MKNRRPFILTAVATVAVLVLLATSGCAVWRIRQSAELARDSDPYQALPQRAEVSLLVVGDSTAAGTGASSPRNSLPGLIARDHPYLEIVNRAKVGAKFADIARQLEGGSGERFDAILILGGGNDVIRLTRDHALEQDVARSVSSALRLAKLVVLMPSGNVGNVPFFFAPWSWLMTQRSKVLHRFAREAAANNGALYVNLYKDKADDPFAQRPDALNAKDGLHPSDDGYRLWYHELDAQTGLSAKLSELRRPYALRPVGVAAIAMPRLGRQHR